MSERKRKGVNPRSFGVNPRALGVAPRQLGLSNGQLRFKTTEQIAQAMRKAAFRLLKRADKLDGGKSAKIHKITEKWTEETEI